MAQEHWGRPEELQRGRGDPPQLGRPPPPSGLLKLLRRRK